ncbi:hypothetical protein ScPMuIL_017948 [Solemya velum]
MAMVLFDSQMEVAPEGEGGNAKNIKENDCTMSTILQPTAMTRHEMSLHQAAKDDEASTVKQLLSNRVDVNCRNNLDRSALHLAAANGNTTVLRTLLEHGADLELKDKYGMSPVLWASWCGHLDALKMLVSAGATTMCTNKQGQGVLHCAVQNNNVSVMNFTSESIESFNVNEVEKDDRTSLHMAARAGHLDSLTRLIDLGCDISKKDKCGATAVHCGAEYGHHECVKRLLMVGVEIDDRDVEGRTALHLAAEGGYVDVVDVLLDYAAGPNTETIRETTPLHLAAANGHRDACARLIKAGATTNSQNFQGNTPLHLSVMNDQKDVTALLLDNKCEVDLPNNRLQTALHMAVESGFQDVVEVLLAGGASLDTKEKSGKTALQLASRGSFITIVDMLIKAERYYATARDYHEKELDSIDPHRYLRTPNHPSANQMKDILWRLATKQLKPNDWKKLAMHWGFTPEHIRAIEHQYTGPSSYREHGYRLMLVWLHGVRKDQNVMRLLFEALVAIDRRNLAEQIRRHTNPKEKPCVQTLCKLM